VKRPVLAAAVLLSLAACGATKRAVALTATDTSCRPATTDVKAGTVRFAVKNAGRETTEVYVYAAGDKIMGEQENIGPGTTRTLEANLRAGHYQLACKPGQKGAGVRTDIHVTGPGGGGTAGRPVEVEARDFTFAGLDAFRPRAGETITFELQNTGAAQHEMEINGPDGAHVGEVTPINAGETGKATVKLKARGAYTYKCEVADHDSRGMHGTFTVD
jgi:uncharacterized cupredoxin-like copper-binding protein